MPSKQAKNQVKRMKQKRETRIKRAMEKREKKRAKAK